MARELTANPVLADADYRNLNTALAHITATEEALRKADASGLDVATEIAALEGVKYIITQTKAAFFPTRP